MFGVGGTFRQIKGPAAIALFPFLRCLKTEKYILIFLRCGASFLLKTVRGEQPLRIASKDLGAKLFLKFIREYIYMHLNSSKFVQIMN